MGKTIAEIFSDRYVIPLYQRNFAWRTDEIQQLLQDVSDAYRVYKQNNGGDYYIGSLVVIKRHNGDYEVIDGQQRLTVLSLIANRFKGNDKLSHCVLFYDSRPEVQEFFELLCGGNSDAAVALTSPTLFYLKEAYEFLQNAKVKEEGTEKSFYEVQDVADYFLNHVVLVRNEMPEDTDVAAYFEIMNNRGEQLHKHEIVKARLLGKIKDADGTNGYDINKQHLFAKIWDACSQMDVLIQRLFGAADRRKIFGDEYDGFPYDITSISSSAMANRESSLRDVLDGQGNEVDGDELKEAEPTETDDNSYASIIDFPNFLMHVLKLYLSKELHVDSESVPLNEKDLLSAYQQWLNNIDPMAFVKLLLFCRTVFDRFVVKTIDDKRDYEDGQKWVLLKPTKYGDSLKYTSAFVDAQENESVIKAISMLQVAFRQRIYKNWLYVILEWLYDKCFKNGELSSVRANEYMKAFHKYMIDYYKKEIEEKDRIAFVPDDVTPTPENSYSKGTNTSHFLLNFIDYLYWCDWHTTPNKYRRFNLRDFTFKYWNSVEHHRATNKAEGCHCIHNLGNLCLVSKSSNSRLSDRIVKEKVEEYGKGNLGINRQIIYAETIESNWDWGDEQIRNHYNEIATLLNARQSILSAACSFTTTEEGAVDLSVNMDALGEYIEKNFFEETMIMSNGSSIQVIRRDDARWPWHDEEEIDQWCGRYFKICCERKDIAAFVGWFYGGGNGGKYTRKPRFVIQIDKNDFHNLLSRCHTGWYEDSSWEKWMCKDLLGDLHDVKSVAIEFKTEIESVCANE